MKYIYRISPAIFFYLAVPAISKRSNRRLSKGPLHGVAPPWTCSRVCIAFPQRVDKFLMACWQLSTRLLTKQTFVTKGIPNGFPCRIAWSKHEGCRETFTESVKILEPQASVFLRFPKVEQHPKCMDHAILHGKPFGNCFIK
jgi:hypothetical protein